MNLLQMRQKLIELEGRVVEMEAKFAMIERIEAPPIAESTGPIPMFLAALPRRRGRPPKVQRG